MGVHIKSHSGSRFSGTINGQRVEIDGDGVRVDGQVYLPAAVRSPVLVPSPEGSPYREPAPVGDETRRLMAHQTAVGAVMAHFVRAGVAMATSAVFVALLVLSLALEKPAWWLLFMIGGWLYIAWDSTRDKRKVLAEMARLERGG